MKTTVLALTFFIFGIGVSYFTFNHSIVNKKIQFNEEVESLFDSKISAQEANGKIFQLLFAYFAIDLRDIEEKITEKIQESINSKESKVIEKIVEKIVYVSKEAPSIEKEHKEEEEVQTTKVKSVLPIKNFRGLEKLNFTEYLENSHPILERDKAFEKLNGTHNFIGHNPQGPNFEIEIENLFKLSDKSYRGTSKINYLVLGKTEDAIMVDGIPLNFLKNDSYPKLVTARISKDRYIVINTDEKYYNDNIKGLIFLKSGEKYRRDGLLRLKSK